ncbi:putative RNA-directed DNA polymerase from transposon BS [Trichonephila clavipes]|nr:putative RNA-directed DNA polymerase from transposon BS [Trichonephila clavipes]
MVTFFTPCLFLVINKILPGYTNLVILNRGRGRHLSWYLITRGALERFKVHRSSTLQVFSRPCYESVKHKCIPLFQSGFRKGRSTLDNIITLENKIRNAFVRRNHLVSIFFDIEKAYDRTWRYGILRTLFDFGFRGNLPTFIQHFLKLRTFRASLYVDDLQISCEGSDMRMIERQLQTAVNNIVKWCDTNGHSISASKSCCVHFAANGCCQTPLGRIEHHYSECIRQSYSRIDYGCIAYGSACNSTLQKLDPVHHMALRICSGAFRTSPVQSLYHSSSASSRSSTEEAVSCVLF